MYQVEACSFSHALVDLYNSKSEDLGLRHNLQCNSWMHKHLFTLHLSTAAFQNNGNFLVTEPEVDTTSATGAT
jgi:hypothetical protein